MKTLKYIVYTKKNAGFGTGKIVEVMRCGNAMSQCMRKMSKHCENCGATIRYSYCEYCGAKETNYLQSYWCDFYRKYPEKFVEELLHVKLTLPQKLVLRLIKIKEHIKL